jgi:hypothetical protein
MREKAVLFGSHKGLVGVLTEPAPNAAGHDPRPAIVMSNVGLNHHVGPYRLWVDMARTLARLGFVSLRFDLSGIGDSEPRTDTRSEAERALLDTQEAMSFLTSSRGITQFILVGLCSGVDTAHVLTRDDARVVGAVFIEGYLYSTPAFRVRNMTQRLLSFDWWRRHTKRKLQEMTTGAMVALELGSRGEIFKRDYPSLDRFRSDVLQMVDRGAKLLFAYTGATAHRYNHPDQIHEILGRRHEGKVEAEYYEEVAHIFPVASHRAQLIERVARFLQGHFGRPGSEADGTLSSISTQATALQVS